MPMNSLVLAGEIHAGIITLTLNRPEKINCFTEAMGLELCSKLKDAAENELVRVIVLEGAGRGFCAGMDLSTVPDESVARSGGLSRIVRTIFNPIVTSIMTCDKPVIAKVHGVAAGAGANLALACDLVMAARDASFIQAFSKIGLIPDSGGTFFLPRLVGLARAKAMFMLAEPVSGVEAEAIGMIFQAVDSADLEPAVSELARRLAAQPTVALGLTKRALNNSAVFSLDQQLDCEAELQGLAGQTDDFQEGVRAFLDKRTPIFCGK